MQYVFGYGSLMHPASANLTLQRPRSPVDEMRVAELHGFVRAWQLVTYRIFDDEPSGEAVPAIVLDIRARPGQACNGILIPMHTPAEWQRLDERERYYERLEVTDHIKPLPTDADVVYTYRGHEAYTQLPPEPIVTGQYLDIVRDALRIWGEPFARRYRDSTLPCAFPRHDGACRKP